MTEELNGQERHETELWQVLDWSLWGNGLGDVLRTAMADVMVSALSGEQREQTEACIKAWHAGRGPSMAVGEGTELAKRVAYLEARAGELHQTIGDLRAGWRDADQEHARDVELLLWLHAEAVWKAGQSESKMADAETEFGSAMDEVDRAERENNDLRREVSRLRREVEFEARGDRNFYRQRFDAPPPCSCVTDAWQLIDAGWSRPQCALHPEGGTA